jgi:small subunit ribosomal protein S6
VTRDYELAFILHPEVSEEETRSLLTRLEQIVTNSDGQVVKVNHWGRRRLAYPIERQRDGIYIVIDLILAPEAVQEINRLLYVSENVLRYMVIKRDAKAAQKERQERAEREARAAVAAQEAEARAAAAAAAQESTASEEQGEEAAQAPSAEEQEQTPAPAIAEETESVEA